MAGMKKVIFATTNEDKFSSAHIALTERDIEIERKAAEVPEIQSENPEEVARDKADKIYTKLKHPVIISDDSWSFDGLNGFPGVYMHSMNAWFSAKDFLNLTRSLTNRGVTLTQTIVYQDEDGQKVFVGKIPGTLLTEARGETKHPSLSIISLDSDNGQSIAEAHANGTISTKRATVQVWHEVAEWLDIHKFQEK